MSLVPCDIPSLSQIICCGTLGSRWRSIALFSVGRRRKESLGNKKPPKRYAMRKIDAQNVASHTADGGSASDFRPIPFEVFLPKISSGIEQSHNVVSRRLGIDSCDVGLLLIVAAEA